MTNLLGISGHIGAGKDEVTRIIQYLTSKDPNIKQDYTTLRKRWEVDKFDWNLLGDWKNKKFADGLKDIVCILTGCTREQLEDSDFKNSYLPEEWNKDWIGGHKITYREVMQKVGTDLLRNQFHPDVHVNMLFNKYKKQGYCEGRCQRSIENDTPGHSCISSEYCYKSIYPSWIISDVRFPNEANAIKVRGGINIRVERNKILKNATEYGIYVHEQLEKVITGKHVSETALDNYKFDWIIDNNGSLEDLINAVSDILKAEKII